MMDISIKYPLIALKWNTDIFTGDNTLDNNGIKYSMDKTQTYHIYAHWIDVGTVAKDSNDEKISDTNTYGGFDLFGTQIRNYKFDINYNENDPYYDYEKRKLGLRFVTSIRDDLLKDVDNVYSKYNYLYDEDSKQYTAQKYDLSKNHYVDSSGSYAPQNINYGYVLATKANAQKFAEHYGYDTIKYNATNVNGEKTTSTYKYVQNVECTSKVGGYNTRTNIIDHRNWTNGTDDTSDDYRIMSMVITYNDATEDNYAKDVVARAYLRYIDGNGLIRTFYDDYDGNSEYLKGCCTNFTYVNNKIISLLDITNLKPTF